MTSWGVLEKGGAAFIFKSKDALEFGIKGPLTEELVVVYSLRNGIGQQIQCSRGYLSEMLRCLAPAEVRVYHPDAQIMAAVHEAATREKADRIVH